MAKKTTYFCKECGFETSGWMGKCPGCGAWNSLTEAPSVPKSASKTASVHATDAYSWTDIEGTVKLSEAGKTNYIRHSTNLPEIDTLLGGGVTEGAVILVGGEPGVGKSTLLLQIAETYQSDAPVLYVTGEESPDQIGSRAQRLNINNDNIYICAQTCFEKIAEELSNIKPCLCIVDSVQTLYSDNVNGTPGSVSQTREVTAGLVRLAKNNKMPVILVGHITKDGTIAGPKTIEHMVDTVLYFEGERTGSYRILRSVKNRFGKSDEVIFFEMSEHGLIPKSDISSLFIKGRPLNASGSAITAVKEGSRSIAVEIQALLNTSSYGTGQKTVNGIDRNRVSMLLAVIEKHLKISTSGADSFINVIGGLKVADTSCDLAIISAIISSVKDIPIKNNTMILGEVGLSGEIRPVTDLISRLECASSSGISCVVLPSSCRENVKNYINGDSNKKSSKNINYSTNDCVKITVLDFIYVDNLSEAVDVLFT